MLLQECLSRAVKGGALAALLMFAGSAVADNDQGLVRFRLIQEGPVLTKADIDKLEVQKRQDIGGYGVVIHLKPSAAKRLEKFTTPAVGRKLQMAVGHHIYSEARVNSPLAKAFIVMGLTKQEAESLVKTLSSK